MNPVAVSVSPSVTPFGAIQVRASYLSRFVASVAEASLGTTVIQVVTLAPSGVPSILEAVWTPIVSSLATPHTVGTIRDDAVRPAETSEGITTVP